ncbi:MAG: ABC transporter substrate-binding protein [Armatimonadetes bacterium]|nr:ABC transporter substrate-binding protein [Armatimonadota bacterium]
MYRFLAICFATLLVVAGCGFKRSPVEQRARSRVVISIWHPWGGTQKERFERVVEAFNRSQNRIWVRSVFTPNDLSNNQKFFTSVAAGKPPDAVFVDGQQTAAWAEQGALEPLDRRLASDGIKSSDYFPPCWAQNLYKGRVWALTYCADPNFAFVWNKKVFREVGLDPEKPPTTIDELDRFNDRITKREGSKIVRMGIIPWAQYGAANSLFTWGWAFGGEFYDPKTRRVTADHPRVVRALEWMTSYAKRYDPERVNAFSQGFGSREQNPLYIGQVAMAMLHISGLEEIRQYAPNLEYGIGYIPAPPDGERHSSWVGGWCIAIPKGSKHPEAAWEFIKWACRDPKGTETAGRLQGLFPGYRKSPYFDSIRGKPGYGEFLRILEECRHQRPVMPAQAFYMSALARAVDYAVYGVKTPREALEQATRETQAELDLRLAGR